MGFHSVQSLLSQFNAGTLVMDHSYKNYDILDERRKLKIKSAEFWHQLGWNARRTFLHFEGQYFLPTVESLILINDLIGAVPRDECLEIGAGNGWLGWLLGIKMTDSYLQEDPATKFMYAFAQQPIIKYGLDVERMEAVEAVKKYRPHTVIGSWISEKQPDGNPFVVDELEMMKYCKRYIFIGTETQHDYKTLIRTGLGRKYKAPGILSRAKDDSVNAIWVFEN